MGIMINLSVSKNLTQGEWEPVYEETLQLIKEMPLVERRTMSIDGIEVRCLGHTQERVQWQGDLGWKAEGDSDSLRMAEPFYLFRKLPFELDGTAGDPMLDMVLSGENTFGKNAYTLWCNKTQGEAYHMYLLAVAVTLADRLKGKVWVSGDITRGQLREAAALANETLTNPVKIPDTCDIVRWYERSTQLPISEDAKIDAFDEYILVKKDSDYGEFLREHFSRDVLRKYWNTRLLKYYEKEDQIAPDIVESLQRTKDFMKEILEEEDFKELLEGDPEKRCKWIVDQNQFFWLCKPDWDKIFKDVKKGKDAFERYYPIFRVDAAPSSIYDQCLALLINDTFFEYMSTL